MVVVTVNGLIKSMLLLLIVFIKANTFNVQIKAFFKIYIHGGGGEQSTQDSG